MECGQTTTVFLADDDVAVRRTLMDCFAGTTYRVVGEASDGMAAVESCRKLHPNLVLMDIQMPLMDGISAAQIIVEEGLAHCVVMLTYFGEHDYVDRAIQVGASGYLTKPFSPGQILPTLDICIQQSKTRHLLQKNKKSLLRRLDGRELLERAKLILMEERRLSEQEAYSAIRELSRRKKMSMARVAEYILKQSEDGI